MLKPSLLLAVPLLAALPFTSSPAAIDSEDEAVEAAVRDYVEALYKAQPERIERSVHPALEKLGCWRPDDSKEYRTPGKMTYAQLVDLAGHWNADGSRGDDLRYEIEVLDALDVTASAKLVADWGIDYMHLMKSDGRWKIVQIVWQSHPPKG